MAEAKTRKNNASATAYIDAIDDKQRRPFAWPRNWNRSHGVVT